MTVAAVILATPPDLGPGDPSARAGVRRAVETAWAGGAMPIVVVAADPDGLLAGALAGSQATLVTPAPLDTGPMAHLARGMRVAVDLVSGTDAVLAWPARFAWVGPETVTSLLQAHGLDPDTPLRPRWQGEDGWPVLVPVPWLASREPRRAGPSRDDLASELLDADTPTRSLDLGDPGSVIDRTTPIDALPPYQGPSEPPVTPPDWGASVPDAIEELPARPIVRIDAGHDA